MNKKTMIVFGIVVITILSLIMYAINSKDDKILEQTFVIDAVYFENYGYAEISFHDTSNKTNHVTLEILGMEESFHKKYDSSSFAERIIFTSVPKYGWQSMPITFLVEHEKLGKIRIKTEVRSVGDVPAPMIFSDN